MMIVLTRVAKSLPIWASDMMFTLKSDEQNAAIAKMMQNFIYSIDKKMSLLIKARFLTIRAADVLGRSIVWNG